MPLSNLLKSAAGTCPLCNQKAGILSREHQGCRRTHQEAGWNEMVRLASGAARSHEFNPNSLQVSLAEIARRSFGDASTVQRQLLLPVPSIILAGSPPVSDCAAGPLRCGSWGRRIPG